MDCKTANWYPSSSKINEFVDPLPTLKQPAYRNQARFKVGMKIGADRVYAFKIWVNNPKTYTRMMHFGWSIWTEDANGYGVDGTSEPVSWVREQFEAGTVTTTSTTTLDVNNQPAPKRDTAHYNAGWGNYDITLNDLTVWVRNTLPYSVEKTDSRGTKMRQATDIVVFPIEVSNDLDTSMRFTAPYGYVFEDMNIISSYTPTTNATTARLQHTNEWPKKYMNQVN